MVKAVIFDLDGLLADTETIVYRIYVELLQEFGYSFSIEEYAAHYSGKTAKTNIAYCIETYHLPWTLQEAMEKVFRLERQFLEEGVSLKKGAAALLAWLKKEDYRIALATSSFQERALGILAQHQLVSYFDAFVFGPELERGKPYPDIFLHACTKLQEEPGNCLVLEDSESGIQAASAAGIPVICVPDLKKPSPKYMAMTRATLSSLEDVMDFLEREKGECS